MIGDEILVLSPGGGNPVQFRASIATNQSGVDEDDFLERADQFTFRIWRTARAITATASLAGLMAEAKRTMPGRVLAVNSVTPTPDRLYLDIQASG